MDFATAELVGGKHMDIEEAVGFGACDKLALRWLKAITTLPLPEIIFPSKILVIVLRALSTPAYFQ